MAEALPHAVDTLRAAIARIEAGGHGVRAVLPFGLQTIDQRLPAGGLAFGALHEVAGGGDGALHGVLWCVTRADLFAPAVEQVGLSANRVIYVEAGDERAVLACCEEGLRHGGLGAVVGEIARLSMTASRRLQLAAEASGSLGLMVRRWRRQADAADFGQPTAATTRWRVTALPSSPLPTAGVGRPRWFLELIRCKAGECADFEVEAPDAAGRLALPADLAHRSLASPAGQGRAVA